MVDSLLHGEWGVGTTLGLTTLCTWDQGCLPWQGGMRDDLLLGVPNMRHDPSAWWVLPNLCCCTNSQIGSTSSVGLAGGKSSKTSFFVIKVKCSSFM